VLPEHVPEISRVQGSGRIRGYGFAELLLGFLITLLICEEQAQIVVSDSISRALGTTCSESVRSPTATLSRWLVSREHAHHGAHRDTAGACGAGEGMSPSNDVEPRRMSVLRALCRRQPARGE
jgi:hypothetical protein